LSCVASAKQEQTQFQIRFTLCKPFLFLTFPYPGYNSTKRAGRKQIAKGVTAPAEHLSNIIEVQNIDMSPDCNRRPVLILGIGNILLRDEGVGVRVIEQMQKIPLPDNVELIDGGTAGADLLDVLADRCKVIVIDAVEADCEPGTVLRFSADDLTKPDGVGMSLHELGLGEALTMTRQLGCEPKEVVVFGIKPRDISCGLELSEEISASVPKVVELVLAGIGISRNQKMNISDSILSLIGRMKICEMEPMGFEPTTFCMPYMISTHKCLSCLMLRAFIGRKRRLHTYYGQAKQVF
jgi:hydrogenase maturation protease